MAGFNRNFVTGLHIFSNWRPRHVGLLEELFRSKSSGNLVLNQQEFLTPSGMEPDGYLLLVQYSLASL